MKRSNAIINLSDKHKRVIALKCAGYSKDEIIKETGFSLSLIRKIQEHPSYKTIKAEIEAETLDDAKKILTNNTSKAAQTLVDACSDKKILPTQVKAAETILKLSGFAETRKIEAEIRERIIIVDDISEIDDEI